MAQLWLICKPCADMMNILRKGKNKKDKKKLTVDQSDLI